jgi:hypothetical protein
MHATRTNDASGEKETEITRIQKELARRFLGAGGTMARADGFAVFFPSTTHAEVEEALQRLWEDGLVQTYRLSDGALAYHFPVR